MTTFKFTIEQEDAVRMALDARLAYLEHNIKICEKLKLPAFSDPMKIFQNAYGETLSALHVMETPQYIPKLIPTEEDFIF